MKFIYYTKGRPLVARLLFNMFYKFYYFQTDSRGRLSLQYIKIFVINKNLYVFYITKHFLVRLLSRTFFALY